MNNSESKSNKLKLSVSLCILIMCLLVGFIIYQVDDSFVHNAFAEESTISTNNASEQIIDLETSTNSVNLVVQNNVILAFQPSATFSGNLVISADIIEIGYRAFSGDTGIRSISFESGSQLKTIGDYAFANCTSLESIDMIPKRVTSIGDGAFLSCESLTRVTFEDNSWLDIVGMGAFSNCVELQSVDFGVNSWLDNIEAGAFSDCHSLSNIVIPGSVKNIGDGAFLWCSNLTSVLLGKFTQLKRIGIGAFSNCGNLTSITIPNGVSEIGYGAFSFCDKLTIYTQLSSRPSTWDINWNSADYANMERPVLWGCALETDKPYVSSFNKTDSNIYNPESFEIMAPNREDYRFEGWYSNSSFTGISYTAAQISSAPNGIYYAKWFLTTYNITYRDIGDNLFSGIHGMNYPTKHFYGRETILRTPTKVGYIFGGWYTSSNGLGMPISTLSATGYTSDITLYADWIPKTYSITYRDWDDKPFSGIFIGDAFGSPHPTTHTYGKETQLVNPVKGGYTFEGWFLNNWIWGIGEPITSLSATDYTSNITLYAKWTISTYNIIYRDLENNPFSGSFGSILGGYPTTHTYGTETKLVNPCKTGYTFGGWFLDSNGTGTSITVISATEFFLDDIILYAKWIPESYTITYRDIGNTPFSGTHGAGYPTTHTFGKTTRLVSPTRIGYRFDGWFADSNGTGTSITILSANGYTSDITLYAKWTPIYNITYKDVGDEDFSGTHGSGYPTVHTYGTSTDLVSPTKEGYTFTGWYTNNDGTGTSLTTLSATGYTSNITLYAKWTPETYNIIYKDIGDVDFSGTHGANAPAIHTYGTSTYLVNPTKEGYIFDGWYTNSDGTGSSITTLSATGHTSNITLYAKWLFDISWTSLTANGANGTTTTTQLTLSFDKNPGTSFTANNIVVTGATKGTLSGTGTTRTLEISDITVGNGGTVSVSLTNPAGIVFSDSPKNVTVYYDIITGTVGLKYSLINDGTAYEVSKGDANTNGVVIIPHSHNELPVTSISSYAFYNCSRLTSVNIPSSIIRIGRNAFNGTGIWNNTADNSVVYADKWVVGYKGTLGEVSILSDTVGIGENAFSICSSLTTIMIPFCVKNIGDDAFYNSGLTGVTFGADSQLTNIGKWAFAHCKMTSVALPSSVTSLGDYAFYNCNSLTSITFGTNSQLASIGSNAFYNCSSLTDIHIPAGVTDIQGNPIAGCNGINTISVDPNNAIYKSEGNCVIRKSDNALIFGCKNSTIPTYATSIGHDAFRDISALTSITIPNSVTSIEDNAFRGCRSLTAITIPASVLAIGSYAFNYCIMLADVTISNGVESIGGYAFQNCESLSTITIPTSVTTIGDLVFMGCYGLTEINVEASNNNYSSVNGVLYNKSQTTLICYPYGKAGPVVMAAGISEIAEYAFAGCNITSIVIPASVTKIGYGAFSCCAELATVTFETGSLLTEIGDGAFECCTSLLSIKIPAGVTSLSGGLFISCESLVFVTFEANSSLKTIYNSVFDSCYNLVAVQIPIGVEYIQTNAFNYCTGIEKITIPATVTYMEGNVFEGWTSEQTIYIAADYSILDYWDSNWAGGSEAQIVWLSSTGYTSDLYFQLIQDGNGNYGYEVSVGDSLYDGNTKVIIPDKYNDIPVIRVADYGFYNCTELTKVAFASNALVYIGEYAFSECNNLVNINLPNTVTYIGENAFSGCSSLHYINIPNTVTYIGDYAFAGCDNLLKINIPASVTSIGVCIFDNCYDLKSITIPSAVIYFEYEAFRGAYSYTLYTEADYEPNDLDFLGDITDFSVFWGCTLSTDKSYVVSITISDDNMINTDPLYPPYREGYAFVGWSTTANGLPQYTMQDIIDGFVATNTVLYAVWISI